MLDCENSTAVSCVAIMPVFDEGDNAFVSVKFRSGDEWGYFVPTSIILIGLGEQSVGRFVATVVKPNATFATLIKKSLVSV